MVRHLQKSRWVNDDFILGLDFKSTNNNLEFGGANVQASAAELFQIRIGNDYLRRGNCDQYERLQSDLFIGPGDGFSSNNTTQAFSTIRPNTSPDYMYGRVRYESATNVGDSNDWQLTLRATGQLASERVLFSEMLGFGGYDTIRGYDQRALSGDHGWLTSVELGYAAGGHLRLRPARASAILFVSGHGQSLHPESAARAVEQSVPLECRRGHADVCG